MVESFHSRSNRPATFDLVSRGGVEAAVGSPRLTYTFHVLVPQAAGYGRDGHSTPASVVQAVAGNHGLGLGSTRPRSDSGVSKSGAPPGTGAGQHKPLDVEVSLVQ